MNGKLRLALIGAGGIGVLWSEVIKKSNKAVLAAVIDLDIAKAKAIAESENDCLASIDYKEILNDSDLDGVVVATPHKFLAPISLDFLKAKKNVLCEKPAGISSAEIKKNIDVAEKNQLAYMVGFNHRYHPAFLLAKEKFVSGEIGKLLFIRARYGFGGKPNYQKEWRFNKEISGGGELIDQGVHMIDMSRWFMGDIQDVKGFASTLLWQNGVEDNGFALLRGKGGGVASIHVSWTNWNWIHTFEIFGEQGYLIIEGLDQRYRGPERLIIGRRHPEFLEPPKEEVIKFENEDKDLSLGRELEEFILAIQEKRDSVSSGKDAYEVLKIVEKIYAQN